ncbi:hypothetical protein [Phreatobacter sp.]|uniref:hypothetical protein n=1 Tax=Phreatobacter sp. TaxID=1966341 RepID=UPI003F72DE5C
MTIDRMRRASLFALPALALLAAAGKADALTIRGPGGRPGGFRPIDPGIGNGQRAWSLPRGHLSRRAIIGEGGNGPDPRPRPMGWRNRQGGLLGGLNPQAPTPSGYPGYACHPRRRMAGLC